ncbi:hypothetical protein V8C86DRAFT_2631383 [Haematococcus lacustris]
MLWALALGSCPSPLLARSGQSGRVCSGQIRSHTSGCGPSNCNSNLPIRISGSSSEPVAWAGQSRCWKRPRRWRGGPVKRNVSHPPSGSGSHSNSTNSQASNIHQPVCTGTEPRPQGLAVRHHHCLGRPALTGRVIRGGGTDGASGQGRDSQAGRQGCMAGSLQLTSHT